MLKLGRFFPQTVVYRKRSKALFNWWHILNFRKMTKHWYPHVAFNPNNPYCYYHIWQCFFIVFFFLDDLEKKLKRRLQKIYGQNELKSRIEMMSRRPLFDKKRLKATLTDNLLRHMIFAGNPGTEKTMADRCMPGNNNSI